MKGLVTILNFDDVYRTQSFCQKTDCEWIDLSDVRNANRYCETQSLAVIKKRLLNRNHKGVTFIGSGNYHYVSYLLLSEIQSPFTLVLFDHHTDMMAAPSPELISCGSWVLNAMKRLPLLRKVVIIGAKENLAVALSDEYKKKVTLFTDQCTRWDSEKMKNAIFSVIPTGNVYISIDKDVLNKSEAVTNWDQGNMRLTQLMHILQYIMVSKKICGVDVCGEQAHSPADYFRREYIQAARTNEKANKSILETLQVDVMNKNGLTG